MLNPTIETDGGKDLVLRKGDTETFRDMPRNMGKLQRRGDLQLQCAGSSY